VELSPSAGATGGAEEAADQAGADRLFDSVGDVLRELTRDPDRFRVLLSENVSYGFRRNAWGLKSYGLAVAIMGCVVSCWLAWFHPSRPSEVAAAMNALLAIYWLKIVDAGWGRVVAFEYVKRLLASLDELVPRGST